MRKWQGLKSAKTAAPAVFNNPNGDQEMPNQHIMALALALCNASNGRTVRIPAMTGSQLKALLDYIRALK
ncbi:TPA: hypothetical protein JD202_02790 [Cronobacter sakazakii]|nr:hypothetical protein C3O72_07635 [Cronobacter sakazakii]HAU5496538.1 hypothetical protein [Cronobacter sakazakii]HBX2732677.1 hypothetical protein [Klebsiella pneumoniae]